jgi:ABC-2 type transport system ATP-binding protein
MIALDRVAARRAPLSRADLTLAWGAGLHSIVGAEADGGPLLLAVMAGRERTRRGTVQVLGGSPRDEGVREQIALVSRAPSLPDALRVGEVLDLAARIRGEPARPARDRLAVLGIESLAARPVRTLAHDEARAVTLAEAITSTRVRVLLVDEPLVGMDPRAAGRAPELLRARGREGCAVVVATASVRDAGELCDDHVLLRQGVVAGTAASLDALGAFTVRGTRMRVLTSDAQALVAALALEPDVEAIARHDGAVTARGRDAVALARAVGRAVTASGVDLVEMRFDPPTLDEARMAAPVAAAAARAAIDAARRPPPVEAEAEAPPPEVRS